jgi:hypothetical protein
MTKETYENNFQTDAVPLANTDKSQLKGIEDVSAEELRPQS